MTLQPSEIGTPQGGPLSPLLANILLDDLDTELQTRGHRFARYADDRNRSTTPISSKSYWRLSKTQATHSGMTNDWLKQ